MNLITIILIGILTTFASCNNQNKQPTEQKPDQIANNILGKTVSSIGKNIRCIFKDSKHNYWFSTNEEGVFKYDGKSIIQFTDKDGLCSNSIWYIQESIDGIIWFKTEKNTCSFDGKQFSTPQTLNEVSAISDIKASKLLIDYYHDGKQLNKFQLPKTSPLTNNNNYHTPYFIYCTFKDSKGNIWFGTDSRGVCMYDGNKFTWLNDKELGVAIRSIFEDKNGNIWIGNNGYGLFRYDGKTITNITKQYKLENPDFLKSLKSKEGTLARVWAITDDIQGNLWIGTIDNGIWKYDGNKFTNYTTKDGLTSNNIGTIYRDINETILIGTDGGGITKYDGKTFAPFTTKSSTVSKILLH